MRFSSATEIISQIRRYDLTDTLTYHVMGEPLLNPELGKIMGYARGLGFRNILNTNASVLNPDVHQDVWDSADAVMVSFRSDQDHFERDITATLNFRTYLKRIKALIGRPGGKRIILRFFDPSALRHFSDLVGKFEYRTESKFDFFFENGHGGTVRRSFFGRCDGMTNQLAILADGSVTTCCYDYEGSNAFGNALTDDLGDILEGERAAFLRNRLRLGLLPTGACQRCFGARGIVRYGMRQFYNAAQVVGLAPGRRFI